MDQAASEECIDFMTIMGLFSLFTTWLLLWVISYKAPPIRSHIVRLGLYNCYYYTVIVPIFNQIEIHEIGTLKWYFFKMRCVINKSQVSIIIFKNLVTYTGSVYTIFAMQIISMCVHFKVVINYYHRGMILREYQWVI